MSRRRMHARRDAPRAHTSKARTKLRHPRRLEPCNRMPGAAEAGVADGVRMLTVNARVRSYCIRNKPQTRATMTVNGESIV